MDIVTVEQRSRNMSAIKSVNTRPELYIRKMLFSKGYRYSINSKKVPGHPDLYLRKYNTVIFVHGCFWHRHEGCRYAYMPKSRVEFWQKKFNDNIKRDCIVREELKSKNIKCLIIWECSIKQMKKNTEFRDEVFCIITEFLKSRELYIEI
ncbi:MAG: very short patch repair endonuclease [Phascolarctobacterium sp.]|uniref:very short patch repair endonuclease n=1 Tax=Phascolarctobacterium sp. TaxID=2049039 RepID=UPI0025F4ED6B|nr:very short patch repair endonuclease [Phascolarctobacterium sp.]MCC8159694.1 very short patch repair endonuclease [Phascolarctobacterium sp.]